MVKLVVSHHIFSSLSLRRGGKIPVSIATYPQGRYIRILKYSKDTLPGILRKILKIEKPRAYVVSLPVLVRVLVKAKKGQEYKEAILTFGVYQNEKFVVLQSFHRDKGRIVLEKPTLTKELDKSIRKMLVDLPGKITYIA